MAYGAAIISFQPTGRPQLKLSRHECSCLCAQAALQDLDESLRLKPGDALALSTRADAKRLLKDHVVNSPNKLRQTDIYAKVRSSFFGCPTHHGRPLDCW